MQQKFINLFAIFLGGGSGSVIRYLLSKFVTALNLSSFPLGIISVNIAACFLSGIFVNWLKTGTAAQHHTISLLLIVGFCGGFSTFSAFTDQTLRLFMEENNFYALLDIFMSLILCMASAFGGMMVSKLFFQ